jgi:hypothetical protein
MVGIGLQIGALATAAAITRWAHGATRAAVVLVAQEIDTLALTAASAIEADSGAVGKVVADRRATVAADAAVVRVRIEIADALTVAAGFIVATDRAAGAAVIAIRFQIDADPVTARLAIGAGSSTVAAVGLVGVELVALAVAFVAPGLAFALAVLAAGALATVAGAVAVTANLLAGGLRVAIPAQEVCRDGSRQQRNDRSPGQSRGQASGECIEGPCFHG